MDTGNLDVFLNENTARDMDIVEILDEGRIEEKISPKDNRVYNVLNLSVQNGSRKLIYTPNKDALEVLKKAFGKDTANWVNKKFQVKIYPKTAFGITKNAILPVIM
jgi:hypothetical protein